MARSGRSHPVKPLLRRPDLGTVYFDNASTSAYQAALSTYNWSHTVGANSNRLLVVGVSIFAAGSVSAIDYGGTALTKLRSDDTGVYRSEVWYLVAPAAGTATITVTLSASLTSIAGGASWWNVDQPNPFSAHAGGTGTNTPASQAVTPGSTLNRVFGNLSAASASGVTNQSRQAPHYTNAGAIGTQIGAELGTILTAASTTLQWDGLGALDVWAVSLAAIQPPQVVTQVYGWDPGIALLPSPRPFSPALRVVASNYVPTPDEIGGDGLGWLPQYPDRVLRLWLATANQQPFITGAVPSTFAPTNLGWKSTYPDRVDRPFLLVGQQLAFVTGAVPSTFAPTDMGWKGTYPDRIDRPFLLVGQQLAFITGAVPSTFAPTDLGWKGTYPDRIDRWTIAAASQLAYASPITATIPSVPAHSWGSIYPDRISRATLHPAGMPFFSLGPLVPIPNPPVTFIAKDHLVLGQKEAFGVTSDPTLGGWTW